MKLNDKLYCDICYKRVDNYVDPMDITYCYSNGEERHYCRDHCNIGEMKLYEIYKDDVYREILKNTVIRTPYNPSKKEKIQRVYQNDDFIIDLFPEDRTVRVSVFDDGHFQDEMFIRKEDYCG